MSRLDAQLVHLAKQLESLDKRLDKVDKHLAVNNTLLDIHIKRTNILEEEFRPVRDHVKNVQWLAKLIAAIVATAAAVTSIFTFWK